MKRSRVIVLVVFATNAALNVLLLGILARLGGLDLVGTWSFLSAVQLFTLLADYGVTNALVYSIGRNGLQFSAPMLRTLLLSLSVAAVFCFLGGLGAGFLRGSWAAAIAMTIMAGISQLGSNWLIAIRMGQHEQYWFNIKTVIRVVLQTALALGLYFPLSGRPELAFGVAFLLAGFAEVAFSWWMVRSEDIFAGPRAGAKEILTLTRGFGPLTLVQRGMDPISRFLISALAGAAALGTFTVAQRIPVVINQAVSEALRALLPGLSRMDRGQDREAACKLLAEAVTVQTVLVVGPLLIFMIQAPVFLSVWLGQSDPLLVNTLRALSVATLISCVTTPFFWASQAFGRTTTLARLSVIRAVVALSLGAIILAMTRNVLGFAIAYALGQIASGAANLHVANGCDHLVTQSLKKVPRTQLIIFTAFVVLVNLTISYLPISLSSGFSFMLVSIINSIAFIPSGIFLIRRNS